MITLYSILLIACFSAPATADSAGTTDTGSPSGLVCA